MPVTALINTVPTFRRYYPVAFSTDAAGLPDFAGLEQNHIVPIIGQQLYDALLADINNTNYAKLLDLLRRVEAPIAVLEDVMMRHVQIGDAGLKQLSPEGTVPVPRWQFNELKYRLQVMIGLALDKLWRYLYDGQYDFEWTDPSSYTLLVNTAGEFSTLYPLSEPYRMWQIIRPILYKVETFTIATLIGADFLDEMKRLVSPSADEAEAIMKMKLAAVYSAMVSVVVNRNVKVTADGVTVLYHGTTDMVTDGQQSAPDANVTLLIDELQKDASAYRQQLKSFLDSNASTELFATYYASTYYTAPGGGSTTSRNANSKIFRL